MFLRVIPLTHPRRCLPLRLCCRLLCPPTPAPPNTTQAWPPHSVADALKKRLLLKMKEEVGGLLFDSDFDSGNLGRVEETGPNEYVCTVCCDCEGTPYVNTNSSWFYFRIKGGSRGRTVTLQVKTQNAQTKLYGFDMRPVMQVGEGSWSRITTRPETEVSPNQQTFFITWQHTFESSDPVSFAFTYPYPYEHLCSSVAQWEQSAKQARIVFERSVIGRSLEGRDLELLTITSPKGRDADKRVVLLSARVHPGETPGSHMLHGLIDFLLKPDSPVSMLLRSHFIFRIVPCLNPDGVVRGHYRTDTLGVNLNRMYESPKIDKHPTILAMKKLFLSQNATGRLALYVDFHAHATKRGCFMYGNALSGEKQVENLLFPRLLSLNSEYFDYDGCNFTQKNMKMKGKKDGLSKRGTGRVALYRETGMVQCYTLEANYNKGLPTEAEPCPESYTQEVFHSVGRSVLVSLLDMVEKNPQSVLPSTQFGDVNTLRASIARSLKVQRPPSSATLQSASGLLKAKRAVTLPTLAKADDNVIIRAAQGPFRPRCKRPSAQAEKA